MIKHLLYIILISLLTSCGSNSKSNIEQNTLSHASRLAISHNEGFSIATIFDPWNEGKVLQSYIFIPKDAPMPDSLPKGTIVRTPVERALVYSSVHAGVMKELGCINAVKGVCDVDYIKIPEILNGIKDGTISNAGSSMAPTIEKIIELKPEVIILSPFQNGGYGTLTTLGIPIIECADYMENSPLGRAEWIKLFGLLFSKSDEAESIFNATANKYNSIRELASSATNKPSVLTEYIMSGVWFVPGGKSYMAQIITDAGASYPWSDNKDSGSLQLDFSQVLSKAQNADFWLIKSHDINSYSDLEKSYELNKEFNAFKKQNVWLCNTTTTQLFEEFPFHPELLLQEFLTIFHPELSEDYELRYYHKLPK